MLKNQEDNKSSLKRDYSKIADNKERYNALDKDAMDMFRKKKPQIK